MINVYDRMSIFNLKFFKKQNFSELIILFLEIYI